MHNLIGVYRPPNGNRTKFIKNLDDICNISLMKNVSTIAGDFNIDISLNNEKSYCSKDLSDMMRANGYYNVITSVTRPNNVKQSTTIDHIWHNSKDSPKSYTLQTDISDHLPCIILLETPRTSPVQKVISYRLVSNNRKASFLLHIRNTDFS